MLNSLPISGKGMMNFDRWFGRKVMTSRYTKINHEMFLN